MFLRLDFFPFNISYFIFLIVMVLFGSIPHCLMWCIWQERNNRCFEDFERTIADLKLFIFKTLSNWMLVIYAYDYFVPLLYTSYIFGWLISMSLNKIFLSYQYIYISYFIFLEALLILSFTCRKFYFTSKTMLN